MPRRKKVVQENALAVALASIAQTGEQVENVAASVLRIIEAQNIRDEKALDAAVQEAYKANGWNEKPGRPKAGDDRRVVPHTVRTYVWEVRSALREGLEVWTYPTFSAMRAARRASAEARRASPQSATTQPEVATLPPEVAQDFEGVRVLSGNKPNGALFHDLAVCYVALKPDDRALFGRQLSRLLHKWQPSMQQVAKAA